MTKKVLSFVIIAVLLLSIPVFANASNAIQVTEDMLTVSGNNRILTTTQSAVVWEIPATLISKMYSDSSIKYYTFNANNISIRTDKNNFFDFNLYAVRLYVESRGFAVEFLYQDGGLKVLTELNIEATYTVWGNDITPFTVPVFSWQRLKCTSAETGKMVFKTKKLGPFLVDVEQFTDVADPSIWYYKYVSGCAALGILNGMGDGSFAPQKNVTRAELCVMVVKATEHIISYRISAGKGFADVNTTDWFYDYVLKCASLGIVYGRSATQYAPNENATRQEIAAITARVIRLVNSYKGQPLPDSSDVASLSGIYPDYSKIGDWAKSDVLLCFRLGVMIGDNGFRPTSNTTRAECARIFYDIKNYLN